MTSDLILEKLLQEENVDRRLFLKGGLALSATALISTVGVTPVFAAPKNGRYEFSIHNMHTGESYTGVYRVGNEYLPDAFEGINKTLRDHRSGEVFPIDPRVIDIAAAVHRMSGSRKEFQVLSGYRSPKTNNKLRKKSGGVAKQSLHMSGQAMDLKLPDVSTTRLRELAIKLKAGGVGYYPRSGFVHVDSGQFRTW
ncbi:MAG: YcbK family protein [Bdellovibrionales bacterium]